MRNNRSSSRRIREDNKRKSKRERWRSSKSSERNKKGGSKESKGWWMENWRILSVKERKDVGTKEWKVESGNNPVIL